MTATQDSSRALIKGHGLSLALRRIQTGTRGLFSASVLYRTSLRVRKHIVEATVIAKSGIAVWRLLICTLQIVS
jgi:hypothetical protein